MASFLALLFVISGSFFGMKPADTAGAAPLLSVNAPLHVATHRMHANDTAGAAPLH